MLTSLALALAARPAASQEAPATQDQVPVVQAVGDFYVLTFDEGEEGAVDLETLTKLCQEATGINFTYDDATGDLLKQAKVRMFGQKRIPKEDFYSFYQILMFINGFVCTQVGSDPLALVVVRSTTPQGGRTTQLKNDSIYVLPDELDDYADQVATPITTVLHLNIDARQLTNSLRSLLTDTNTQSAIPVGNTNSLILQGYASQIVSLARFLRLVDEEMAREQDVHPVFEVIPLEYAAAEDVADMIEQLLESAVRTRNQNRAAVAGATGTVANSTAETKILVDARTNSLLVMAMEEDMDSIKELVARLDVDVVEPERTYHIFALENVQAEDVSQVLDDFISDAQRVNPTGGTAGQNQQRPQGGARGNENEVVVVPDPITNSLLIAASKSRYEEVTDLIRNLDQRQDQVLIETALIELSDSDSRDIGVELGAASIPGAGQTGGFGVSQFGLSSFVDSDGDQIPDIRVPNSAFTGLSAGILDGDNFNLPILIQALEESRTSNVLNVPSVLVNNNSSAQVISIDEQPTTTLTESGNTGTVRTNFNGYEQAGITMEISPSISASGYLRLSVYLEVSNFQGSFSELSNVPPPRVTRTIRTQVNVPDGDTMVIGGIITDNTSKDRDALPWLGNLPVVGALFRRDKDSDNRVTLYFFVTPHILEDKDFADLAEMSYQIKLKAAEVIGADRVRVIDPSFGESGHAVDLSGFDVPLYQSPGSGEVSGGDVGLDDASRRQELMKELEQAETQKQNAGGGQEP